MERRVLKYHEKLFTRFMAPKLDRMSLSMT